MIDALVSGFDTALRRWWLAAILWQVNLLFGAVFAGLVATTLGSALDGSWFSRSLLNDLDLTAFIALSVQSAPALKLLGATAVTLGILYVAGWLGLHGAVVASVSDDNASLTDALQAGARLLPLFFRIWCVVMIGTAVALLPVGVVTALLLRLVRGMASEGGREALALAGLLLASLVLMICVAVHDHARLRAATGEDGAWGSVVWAARFAVAEPVRVFGAALALQVAGLALWAVYQIIASALTTDWMTGVVLALLWGEVFLAGRMLLRIWAFAAQAKLQFARRERPSE